MKSVSFEELATITYILTDDWYQRGGKNLVRETVGQKLVFSNSAVLTLLLLMDFLPFPGEGQFLGFIRANYLTLFPQLLDQSQLNRRARQLRLLIEAIRKYWLEELGVTLATEFLLDTKPLPVVGYKRSKKHSDFAGSAAYGYCTNRNMHYFGYKLVTLSTMDGVPVAYDLVSANTDERLAAKTVLSAIFNCDVFCDKGFIGEEWQTEQLEIQGNHIWTPARINQKLQNPKGFDR